MHQLTIDDSTSVVVSGHSDFEDAHRALLRYVIGADRYLHIVDDTAARTRYQLLRLADPDDPRPARVPRITGTATIEELPDAELPAPTTQFAARDAHRRIAEHPGTRLHGSVNARPLPADNSEQQTGALIWYHTPLRWGANAP